MTNTLGSSSEACRETRRDVGGHHVGVRRDVNDRCVGVRWDDGEQYLDISLDIGDHCIDVHRDVDAFLLGTVNLDVRHDFGERHVGDRQNLDELLPRHFSNRELTRRPQRPGATTAGSRSPSQPWPSNIFYKKGF